MGMNLGDVLWDNALRDATPVESTPASSGFEVINATDWRDFTLYRPAATSNFTVVVTNTRLIDSFVTYVGVGQAGSRIWLEYESSVGIFTSIGYQLGDGPGLSFFSFSQITVLAGRRLRISFTGNTGAGLYLKQIAVGLRLTLPIGEWADKTPHALNSGYVVENVISMNGSIIARNLRRVEKSGAINLEYLTEGWVRTYWEPFTAHAARYGFFYRWNPTDYPSDIIFAVADQINPPANMMPPPLMKVSMPFKGITA